MKWNRKILGITALTTGATLLSGCAGGSGAGGNSGGGGADGTGEVTGAIEVAWWGGDARNEKTNAVIDMFVEANEGVTANGQSADFQAYFDKLNVQAASQSLPCAVQLQGRQLNDYTSRDLLLPLDPMIESGSIDVSDIPEAVVDAGRGPDGNLYFLPYGAAYDAVGINVTLAEEAGVEIPAEGYTWEDFVTFLEDAAEGLPEGTRAVDSNGGRPNFFIGWTQANGKTLFNDEGKLGFTQEDLVEYWTMWEQMREAGVTETAERTAEEPGGPDQGYFANGQLMSDTIPGNALTPVTAVIDGKGEGHEVTTIPYPSGPEGSGNALYPSGFAIPKSCDNVPTAAAFIDFFTNDLDAGLLFASDNGAATNTAVLEAQLADPELSETKKHELELFQQIVANNPPTIVFPPGYQATFEAAFRQAYEQIAFGRQSIEEAAAAFIEQANAGLGG